MSLNLSPQSQAILLLTAWFSEQDKSARPLTSSEWGRFAHWLKEQGATPEALLSESDQILEEWRDRSVTADRIKHLLERSAALGLALEKWQRAGLWVLTRSDRDYPRRLKDRLKQTAPPVLFGCGNRDLLMKGGIAVVGSRDASEHDLEFTLQLGRSIASQGSLVISGGARGVDETAMRSALDHGGKVVGVLADSLLRSATSAKYRSGLLSGNLVLISPFSPEAGFDRGNAMARNKYIYCLSDAAVVVSSKRGEGGTWNGAVENLRAGWVPVWVKSSPGKTSGCDALVALGAQLLSEVNVKLEDLISAKAALAETSDLFVTLPVGSSRTHGREQHIGGSTSQDKIQGEGGSTPLENEWKRGQSEEVLGLALYDCFLALLSRVAGNEALTVDAICEKLDVHKSQANMWLKRATSERRVAKLRRPVRYQVIEAIQPELFDER